MNACFGGFEYQLQFVPNATHPIEPRYGTLAALLLLVGTSPLRRLPCRAHPRLQARVVAQADSRLSESPATPLPAHRIAAHSGASLVNYAG
ncbi:MAG: hypothetical protein ACKOF9_11090 [Burkholderiales bacterium]